MTPNNPEEDRLPTPFARPSWEPRFALDGQKVNAKLIQLGLVLHLAIQWREGNRNGFMAFTESPTRLVVASPDCGGFPRPLESIRLFEGQKLELAAGLICKWLESDAQYPKQPWFDGGALRGFQMFHVAFNEEPRDCYGFVVIEPKWFEVHK